METLRAKEKAAAAAKGLGGFADWFASQIGGLPDVDEVEKELQLLEKLESTLRKHAGLTPKKPRSVPTKPGPNLPPPEVDVF